MLEEEEEQEQDSFWTNFRNLDEILNFPNFGISAEIAWNQGQTEIDNCGIDIWITFVLWGFWIREECFFWFFLHPIVFLLFGTHFPYENGKNK